MPLDLTKNVRYCLTQTFKQQTKAAKNSLSCDVINV